MRKLVILFSIFLLFSFSITPLTVNAQPVNIKLSEGIYNVKDLKLMENISYSIQNNSTATIFMIRTNGNQELMEAHRLESNSIKYNVGPFKYIDKIVIIGPGTVTITS